MSNWYKEAQRSPVDRKKRMRDFMTGFLVPVGLGAGAISNFRGGPRPAKAAPVPAFVQHESPKTQPSTQPSISTTQPAKPTTQPSTRPASPMTQPAKPTAQPKKDHPASNTVARVLFSETAGVTPEERKMVASVMKNRIGNKAFGGAQDLTGVVKQPRAFEALNDPNNSNWPKTANPAKLNAKEKAIWDQCVALSKGDFAPAKGPSGRPLVYYHDKSITKPKNWDNRYWTAVKEVETPHFIFYSVIPHK